MEIERLREREHIITSMKNRQNYRDDASPPSLYSYNMCVHYLFVTYSNLNYTVAGDWMR